MDETQKSLLSVWREIGRPVLLSDSMERVLGLIRAHVPLESLVVRQIEQDPASPASVVTIAGVSVESPGAPAQSPVTEHRRAITATELRRLNEWNLSRQPLQRRGDWSPLLSFIAPPDFPAQVLALPLGTDQSINGVLLLACPDGHRLTEVEVRFLTELREPFSVALSNDQRLHELNRLRQAAEAERGALLRRLGRTDLGEKIVGEETGLRAVMERVALVIKSEVPVLILGETGTGKELVARALHLRGPRQQGPFIRVNCGAIPAELIDSQLFGHEKGSFTGADQSRQGWFERADGGTLFLDEIGELPLEAQVRFLRVLQDGFVERVGSANPIHVDVRVVAATHRDLAAMVKERRFREDLWYRLAVFPVLLPPLRERQDDIPELASYFADRAAARFTLNPCGPTESDLRLLKAYAWPGNIRELGAVIDRAAILGDGKTLEVAKALGVLEEPGVDEHSPLPNFRQDSLPIDERNDDDLSLDTAMRRHIQMVLAKTNGRIEGPRGAAALLQINPHTLRARMRKLNISWADFRD